MLSITPTTRSAAGQSSQRSATYIYQPFNRLTGTSTASYLYDNNGNMTMKSEGASTTQFAWDFENRLVQVLNMALATWDALRRFGSRHGCPCRGSMSIQDWQTVRDFINEGYDLSTDQGMRDDFWREISDEQLRVKIQILGVPWRSQNGRSRP